VHEPHAPPQDVDALVRLGIAHLTGYQSAAYARRYEAFVQRVRAAECAVPGHDAALPFTRAVAASLLKLMASKDEYEVARLYTDGEFRKALEEQFEGDFQLEFHMAPPLVARGRDGGPPQKMRFGPWMLRAMHVLAKLRTLRGTPLDVFGYTAERRTERALVGEFMARIDALLPDLRAENLGVARDIATVAQSVRGYGHIKQRNLEVAREREAELLYRFDPQRYPRPEPALRPGQLRGIPVVSA
jgi:indolepyruvate ferredoxin oxidoreductase